MPTSVPHSADSSQLLPWIAQATAFTAVVGMLIVLGGMALRISYPYELEWMEGGVLAHIARVRAGEPIYVRPSSQFVPFIYPPLYYVLGAAASWFTGEGFLGPRLVSVLAFLGQLGLIFRFVQRETDDRLAALCAAGFYTVTYDVTGRWFDVARVDNLLPLLVLAAAYLLRFRQTWRSAAVAGLLIAAAFFAKQSALVFAGPLLVYCLIWQTRRLPALVLASALPAALGWWWLHATSDGWFTYYIFTLPKQHPIAADSHWRFWVWEMLGNVPYALGLVGLLVFLGWRRRHDCPKPSIGFYALLGIGGLATSYMSRLHTGAHANVLLPVFAALAILAGLAVALLPRLTAREEGVHPAPQGQARAMVLLATLLQMVALIGNPLAWIPSAADRRAGDTLVATIEQVPGRVLVPSAPYLAVKAGKPGHAHMMAVADILRAEGSEPLRRDLRRQLREQLHDPRTEALLLFDDRGQFYDMPLPEVFRDCGPIVEPPLFRPKSGVPQFAPVYWYGKPNCP